MPLSMTAMVAGAEDMAWQMRTETGALGFGKRAG